LKQVKELQAESRLGLAQFSGDQMKKLALGFLLLCLAAAGCTNLGLMVGYYSVEAGAYVTVDRMIKSNDVVIVKGQEGRPNLCFTRRGWNKVFGPSANLANNGIGWFEYIERNPRLQIFDNIETAVFSNYSFIMDPECSKLWEAAEKAMLKKYKTNQDYAEYCRYLSAMADARETASELKQERCAFNHRNDKDNDSPIQPGLYDYMPDQALLKLGFRLYCHDDPKTGLVQVCDWAAWLKANPDYKPAVPPAPVKTKEVKSGVK
jgi:hypothetical protein